MNESSAFLEAFAHGWAAVLWRGSWHAAVMIAGVWLACRFLPRMPARVRCWAWRLVFVKLLITLIWVTPVEVPVLPPREFADAQRSLAGSAPARVASPLRLFEQPDLPESALALDSELALAPAALDGEERRMPSPAADREATFAVSQPNAADTPEARSPALDWRFWLFLAWLAGLLLCMGRYGAGWRRIRALRAGARLIEVEPRGTVQECARHLGLERVPAVGSSPDVPNPMLTGIFEPLILLPEDLSASLTPSQLRLVLAHELAHARRRDLLWNRLLMIGQALFFFHPLVWLARREWLAAQEIACDDAVLAAQPGAAPEYGAVLVKIIERVQPSDRKTGALAAGVADSSATLKQRISAMKQIRTLTRTHLAFWLAATALVAIATLVPWRPVAQAAGQSVAAPDQIGEEPARSSEPVARDSEAEQAPRELEAGTLRAAADEAAHDGNIKDANESRAITPFEAKKDGLTLAARVAIPSRSGEPVPVEVFLLNESKGPIQHVLVDAWYDLRPVLLDRSTGESVAKTEFGGSMLDKPRVDFEGRLLATLAHGRTAKWEFDLSKAYELNPGDLMLNLSVRHRFASDEEWQVIELKGIPIRVFEAAAPINLETTVEMKDANESRVVTPFEAKKDGLTLAARVAIVYRLGEPATVEVSLLNESKGPIQHVLVDAWYDLRPVLLDRSTGEAVAKTEFGGYMLDKPRIFLGRIYATLEQGRTAKWEFDLNKAYELKPGDLMLNLSVSYLDKGSQVIELKGVPIRVFEAAGPINLERTVEMKATIESRVVTPFEARKDGLRLAARVAIAYRLGDPVPVEVFLLNESKGPIQHVLVDAWYDLSPVLMDGSPGESVVKTEFGGSMLAKPRENFHRRILATLEHGRTVKWEFDLSKAYELKPGHLMWNLSVSYRFASDEEWQVIELKGVPIHVFESR